MYISILHIVGIALVVLAINWFWVSHSCSICHQFYFDQKMFRRCRVCNKLYCGDRITRHEDIVEEITGQLGVSKRIKDTRDKKFDDYPCGLEYITTPIGGFSSSRHYCTIHDPSKRDPKRALVATITPAKPLNISPKKPPEFRLNLPTSTKKSLRQTINLKNKDKNR